MTAATGILSARAFSDAVALQGIGPLTSRSPPAPAPAILRVGSLMGAAAGQGLILVALFGGSWSARVAPTVEPIAPATMAIIEASLVAPTQPEPVSPPVAPVVAASMPPVLEPAVEPVAEAAQQAAPEVAVVAQSAPEPLIVDATPAQFMIAPPPARRVTTFVSKPTRLKSPSRPVADRAAMHEAAGSAAAALEPAAPPVAPTANASPPARVEEALRGRIRGAVQEAVRCPAAARMMSLSGKASVAFDYVDGAVAGEVKLARSAGASLLDEAALTAVRAAHYPKAPPEIGDRRLRLLVGVEEACSG